ncbi:MAG: HypC/HybG/HupF family hydrogenase formation chaperone [Planctomycetes bacterium]|nr:HypC/HybG/HupF family hydrogenase formation chaperone [Planctomycetota bacterium]
MCIAIPSKIIRINGDTAEVDVMGNRREANIALLEDPQVGDYVLIHAGFAISKWCEEEALESLKLFKELASAIEQEDRS